MEKVQLTRLDRYMEHHHLMPIKEPIIHELENITGDMYSLNYGGNSYVKEKSLIAI